MEIVTERRGYNMNIIGYDLLSNGNEGIRYAWSSEQFKNYIESAAFINRSKGKFENISGYTTSVSSGCFLKVQDLQCLFCRTGNMLPFGGFLNYKEIAKQNIFMVLTDIYCNNNPELKNKMREFAYMGQGEPGFSYSQVRLAIELTNRVMKKLGQKVYRHVFATCGVTKAIQDYMYDLENYFTEKVTLHLSLHATINRELIMPIERLYPYRDSLKYLDYIFDISREKTCIGIMLFNNFTPTGKDYSYSNSCSNILDIIKNLNPNTCRLSFCEYNSSPILGSSNEYAEADAQKLLKISQSMGFESKLFSSFGKEKKAACGMLGGKNPDNIASKKWNELDTYAEELINELS